MLQTKTSPSTGRTTNDDGLGILRIILKYPWVFGVLLVLTLLGWAHSNYTNSVTDMTVPLQAENVLLYPLDSSTPNCEEIVNAWEEKYRELLRDIEIWHSLTRLSDQFACDKQYFLLMEGCEEEMIKRGYGNLDKDGDGSIFTEKLYPD